MLLLYFFFFASVFALDCEDGGRIRASYCHIIPISLGCAGYYQFSWNTTNAKILSLPYTCRTPSSGSYCSMANTCLPSCFLGGKVGGNNGWVCADFQASCKDVYANNNGDKWCWRTDPTPGSYGTCMDGPTCHN